MKPDEQRTLAEFNEDDPNPGDDGDQEPPAWARELLEDVVDQVKQNSDRLSRLEASQDHDHDPAETDTSRGYY